MVKINQGQRCDETSKYYFHEGTKVSLKTIVETRNFDHFK